MVHHPEQLVRPVKAQAKTLQIHSKKYTPHRVEE
jgi:hypothetical protein